MARSTSPSYIAEFPLRTSAADERALEIRMDAARHIFNACLDESLKRLALMRQSKDWQRARTMPKTKDKKSNKERSDLFKACTKRFGFDSGSIQKHAEQCRDACWIGDHLGSHDTQTTSKRAFQAVEQFAFGVRGKPRFKGKNRLNSVEGKGDAVIRLRYIDEMPVVLWAGLCLPLRLDPRDVHGWQKQALQDKTKYVRVLRRTIKGRTRWFAQLVQQGYAPRKVKNPQGHGVVGLDLGPSTIAIASEEEAHLKRFCDEVDQLDKIIRQIQRAMDRSRRATNPHAFYEDGTFKKGARITVRSTGYIKLALEKAEVERRLAEARKRSQGELANLVLAMGDEIKTEKISYRSFQKNFGRSVGRRAPSMFISMLKRKAASAGAKVIEFSTVKTRLSQFNHVTGEYKKKTLSERWNYFPDEPRVQRDLYSAWLARFVERDMLDASQCDVHWAAAGPLLRRAASSKNQSASGMGSALNHALPGVRVDRPSQRAGRRNEAVDAVAKARATENSGSGSLRTPCL